MFLDWCLTWRLIAICHFHAKKSVDCACSDVICTCDFCFCDSCFDVCAAHELSSDQFFPDISQIFSQMFGPTGPADGALQTSAQQQDASQRVGTLWEVLRAQRALQRGVQGMGV